MKYRSLILVVLVAAACGNGTIAEAPIEAAGTSTSVPITVPNNVTDTTTGITTPGVIAVPAPPPTVPGVIDSQAVLISECQPYNGSLSVLECVTSSAYQTCKAALIAGNLGDCRANLPVPFLEEDGSSTSQLTTASNLEIEVFSADRAGGTVSGEAEYRISFTTPTRPPAENYDPACPVNVCAEDDNNRDCVRADLRNERTTGGSGGLFGISVLDQPSCEADIGGRVAPDFVDLHRAYEACARTNSWGSSTEIDLTLKTGKLYQFNNPTAIKTTSGNSVTWEYTNNAEVYLSYRNVDLPVDVSCRISRTR